MSFRRLTSRVAVAACRGTDKDILHVAEDYLSVNPPMAHCSLNLYVKSFSPLYGNPLLNITSMLIAV